MALIFSRGGLLGSRFGGCHRLLGSLSLLLRGLGFLGFSLGSLSLFLWGLGFLRGLSLLGGFGLLRGLGLLLLSRSLLCGTVFGGLSIGWFFFPWGVWESWAS